MDYNTTPPGGETLQVDRPLFTIEVTVRQAGEVSVVEVAGPVTIGEGTETLRDTIRELVVRGRKHLLLDLSRVLYLDSSGIGELLASRTAVLNRSGQLKLLKPSRRVQDVLRITRIERGFEIFQDEAAALASFAES